MQSDNLKMRAIGLLQSYRKETTGEWCEPVDMADLIGWLNRRVTEHGVSLVTAKCYRRWLASYFEQTEHPDADQIRSWAIPGSHEAILNDDRRDAASLQSQSIDVTAVESNERTYVYLEQSGFEAIVEQLGSANSAGNPRYTAGQETILMLMATQMTGLRPMEWPAARYLETFTDPDTLLTLGPVLEVHTLKQSNRREDNPLRSKRYLVLDEWPDEQRQLLKLFVGLANSLGDDFSGLYNKVRMTLNRAWKRVNASSDSGNANDDLSVSMYTARHIFAEEIRRSGVSTRFDLAALMGHSMLTNQVFYGPRKTEQARGYSFVLPRPWPGDADEIKRWDYKVNPLRYKYAQGDLFGSYSEDHKTDLSTGSDFGIR